MWQGSSQADFLIELNFILDGCKIALSLIISNIILKSLLRNGNFWHRPKSMKELEALLTLPNSKILSGNTSKHVEKYYQKAKAEYDNIIDISSVEELNMTSSDDNHLRIGSSVSIQSFLNLVASIPANSVNIEKIKSALIKVGSVSMREQERDHQKCSRTFLSMKRTNL